jgi:DNA-binding CsgD family transcriptional regulator
MGRYWFAHPLLAEVLVGSVLPEERRAMHAAFAASAAPVNGAPDGMDVDEIIGLADHYEQAGFEELAFEWALHGASAAEAGAGSAEAIRLLRRALDLWPLVNRPGTTRESLLHRQRRAAEHAGRDADELAAVNELLALLDPAREPLAVVTLLTCRIRLRFTLGEVFGDLADAQAAERLSARYPTSPEYACATALLAQQLLWHERSEGIDLAYRAMDLARACDSERSLGYALTARAHARRLTGQSGGTADGLWAWDIAVRGRDFPLLIQATYAVINTSNVAAIVERPDIFRSAHKQLTALGAPHTYVSDMCAHEAAECLIMGDWRRCTEALRIALGARPSTVGDARARLTAALLASRQGRRKEAEAHLARADELFRERSSFTVFNFERVRVELAVAAGDTERAVALALAGLDLPEPSEDAEWLLALAARALADQSAASRDRREDPAPALRQLRDLRRRHPTGIVDAAGRSGWYRRLVQAMQHLADAETARGLDTPGQAAIWHRAAQACHDTGLAWDEAYCWWREAQATQRDRTSRHDAAETLRHAYRLANELQAAPLLADIVVLARGARIPLTTPAAEASAKNQIAIPGLTAREREILAYLVAGHTYAEIAKALVLSEKTISVHVSNMLRKTGTTNRVELAQLAHRRKEATAG